MTNRDKQVRKLLEALSPNTWRLMEAIVGPDDRATLRQIQDLLRQERGRGEDPLDDELLEIAKLRRSGMGVKPAARAYVKTLAVRSGPTRSGDNSAVKLGGKTIQRGSAVDVLSRKYRKRGPEMERRLADHERGAVLARTHLAPLACGRVTWPPRPTRQLKPCSAGPAGVQPAQSGDGVTAESVDGILSELAKLAARQGDA